MNPRYMYQVSTVIAYILCAIPCSNGSPTVAIVGAGIGGTACAYYLEKFSGNVNTVIFEADSRIGGRLYDVVIDGHSFNIGAFAWTGYQRYIKQLARELEFETTDKDNSSETEFVSPFGFPVWDGTNLVSTTNLVKHHNTSMDILAQDSTVFAQGIVDNYDDREDKTFRSMKEYLAAGRLEEWPTLQSRQYFTQAGVDLEFQNLAMAPVHSFVQLQGMESQVFAMLTSMTIKMGDGRIVGGMQQLPKGLFEATTAQLHLNTSVTAITKTSSGFSITFQLLDGRKETTMADFVVIAAPFEHTGIDFIDFEPEINQQSRGWTPVYKYIITADRVNPLYFKGDSSWVEPFAIFATPLFSDTHGYLYYILKVDNGVTRYYSVYAKSDIAEELNEIFVNAAIKFTHIWEYGHPLCPPHNPQGDTYQDVILAPRVYNLGVMNDLASQMEESVIAARNAALLIKEDLEKVTSDGTTVMYHVSFKKAFYLLLGLGFIYKQIIY